MSFPGRAIASQFRILLPWRKRHRTEVPDPPEPRPDNEEGTPDSLDIYALSVGRPSRR